MEFLNSLKKRSKFHNSPFDHWELNKPLTEGSIKEICNAEIVDLNKISINYDFENLCKKVFKPVFGTPFSHGAQGAKVLCL